MGCFLFLTCFLPVYGIGIKGMLAVGLKGGRNNVVFTQKRLPSFRREPSVFLAFSLSQTCNVLAKA